MYTWYLEGPPRVQEKKAKSLLHHFSTDGTDDTGLTLNNYVGCAHRCVYCYATYDWTPDFYNTIVVRTNANQVLEKELESWKESSFDPVFLSSATDSYQPLEGKYRLTRKCVEILQNHGIPYYVFTKSASIVRDFDLHAEYRDKCVIVWSLTTLDERLKRILEPGASTAQGMLKAMKMASDRGMTVGVNVDPIIPGLTDNRKGLEHLVREVANCGGKFVSAAFLRLRPDIWDRVQKLLVDMKRVDTLALMNDLYSEKTRKLNGYFTVRREYAEEVLGVIRRTAEEQGILFGFPIGDESAAQCGVANLRPKKMWEQEALTAF